MSKLEGLLCEYSPWGVRTQLAKYATQLRGAAARAGSDSTLAGELIGVSDGLLGMADRWEATVAIIGSAREASSLRGQLQGHAPLSTESHDRTAMLLSVGDKHRAVVLAEHAEACGASVAVDIAERGAGSK